jgi:hypothetical protein
MKGIRFMVDFFAVDGSGNRYIKYRQGEVYPPTEETTSQVIAGFAEEVDLPEQVAEPKSKKTAQTQPQTNASVEPPAEASTEPQVG